MFEYLQKTIIIIEIECQNGEESRGMVITLNIVKC